ncbi:MAG: hypothetical protein HYY60_01350 [Parcubacteria group bacterium]|nr:hypothetical protein [Parcubacteria group bacterium]MBI3075015.1 hypothetical protein [Parcubacteria group bacterium]
MNFFHAPNHKLMDNDGSEKRPRLRTGSIFANVEIKKLNDTEVEISAEIPAETFDSYRASAVKKLAEEVSIDGFRKGHIPETVLAQKVGEGAILHETAESALSDAYPKILREHAIRAIGAPEITLTKLARGNPLGFKVKTAVLPEVVLPDYKKIVREALAAADEIITVTDEEVEKAVTEIRKNWIKIETDDKARHTTYGIQHTGTDSSPETAQNDKGDTIEKSELPELTDEFVKKLGNFQTVDEFRAKLKENLREEKELQQKEKKRVAVIDGLLAHTALPVPALLIDAEKERMMAQFKGQILEMGAKPEDYFARIKKTEEEVKKEWNETAKKKVQAQIILGEISRRENIVPDEKEIAEETKRLVERYSDVDPVRARTYIEEVLTNEKVFGFLENVNNE